MDPQLMVVGGGPVGSTVAAHASGLQTMVVEEHDAIGSPVQCTGIIHPRVVKMAEAEETVINTITGLKLYFPGGRVLEVPSDEVKAKIIDRRRFDEICSQRAQDAGADILTGHSFKGFVRAGDKVKIKLEGPQGERFVITPLIVGADGYKSGVARDAGMGAFKEIVRGIQVDLDVELEDQVKAEVFIGEKVAPGFFAWVLPCGEYTRVGLCVSQGHGTPNEYLNALLKRRGFENAKRRELVSGAIPIGPLKRTIADNIMVVGDAAGHVKPLSGGGLYTGMKAAQLAAQTAMDAVEKGDFSEHSLAPYEEHWRADIGKELERGVLIRKAYVGMSDENLDELGKLLDREDAKKVLSTGDIDYPSKLVRPMLRTLPSLLKFSPQIIRSLIRREQGR